MAYGLTLEGFVAKTLAVIREGINTLLAAKYGTSIDTSDYAVEGQVGGIVSEIATLLWELAEAVYASQDVDKATGQALEALCALTGTFRAQASHSAVTLTLVGTPTTPVLTGALAETSSTGRQWETLEDGTLALLASWAPTTVYGLGDQRTNGGNAYVVRTAGVSAGSGGPTTEDDDIVDGTVHWRFMGNGTGADDVLARAVETGPVVGVSGDINVIASPVGGWNSVINLLDASLGEDLMTDERLRILREIELAKPGSAPIRALRQEVSAVPGVTSVSIFVNTADTIGAVGTEQENMPPHSVEVLVRGGDDQAIIDALGDGVAAGIKTHGTEVGIFVDDEGVSHEMKFSRPDEIDIYVDITLTKDPALYPPDGDELIKAAIVAWGDVQKTGKDAVAWAIGAQAMLANIGVIDVSATLIGTAPSPSSSVTIPVDRRQLAVYDTSRIEVTSSDGVP